MPNIIEITEPEDLEVLLGKSVRFINTDSVTHGDTGVVTDIEEYELIRVRMDSHRPEYMDYEDTRQGSVLVELDQIEYVGDSNGL